MARRHTARLFERRRGHPVYRIKRDYVRNAFNECHTLQDSVEACRKAYGHYPGRVLADTIFRT